LSKRGASCFLCRVGPGYRRTSFDQTFSAPLKFYRRKCGPSCASATWYALPYPGRRRGVVCLQPLFSPSIENPVRHDRAISIRRSRTDSREDTLQLRHDLEVHALDRGDQGRRASHHAITENSLRMLFSPEGRYSQGMESRKQGDIDGRIPKRGRSGRNVALRF